MKNFCVMNCSMHAEQREEQLRRRRDRDRATRAAVSAEQRQDLLQRRCDRVYIMNHLRPGYKQREHLATESTQEREARLGQISVNVLQLSRPRKEMPGYRKSAQRRERLAILIRHQQLAQAHPP